MLVLLMGWLTNYVVEMASGGMIGYAYQISYILVQAHVRWVPCHHGKARPRVADGGDSLQFWRVAANILNKQSRTADKGGTPAWGLGVRLTTPHRKK
jgi:hypothetical protein